MSTYFIGDVHGCADELKALLDKIKFTPQNDTLYFTGDLIGRGPYPLETIDIVMKYAQKGCAHTVIGNHELFYMSVYADILKDKPKAMISPILNAQNAYDIYNFISSRPFMIVDYDKHFVLTHAGVYPEWTLNELKAHALELEHFFKNEVHRNILLRNMFDDSINKDIPSDCDLNRLRFSLNVFTRMRFCQNDLTLNYGFSSSTLKDAQDLGLYPWFKFSKALKDQDNHDFLSIFGHWAALQGKCDNPQVKALDTGCLWGGALSCYCLEENSFISVPSLGHLESNAKKKDGILQKALQIFKH